MENINLIDITNDVLDFSLFNDKSFSLLANNHVKTSISLKNFNDLEELEIFVKEGCNVNIKILVSKLKTNLNIRCQVEDNGVLNFYVVDLSDSNINIKNNVVLLGNSSSSTWNLSCLANDSYRKVYNISFDHIGENSESKMINYGVATDNSTLYFDGISHIEKMSVKSNASQKAKIIVYDEKCKARANPCLKIDNNDISANHSAAVGTLNEDHVFYLLSRGIDERNARKLITLGYLVPNFVYFSEDEQNEFNKIIEEKI